MPETSLDKVYSAMQKKYNVKTPFEEFATGMQDSTNRRKVFDALSTKYKMKDSFEDFDGKIVGETSITGTAANKPSEIFSRAESRYKSQLLEMENKYKLAEASVKDLELLQDEISKFDQYIQGDKFVGSKEQFGEYKKAVDQYNKRQKVSGYSKEDINRYKQTYEGYQNLFDAYEKYREQRYTFGKASVEGTKIGIDRLVKSPASIARMIPVGIKTVLALLNSGSPIDPTFPGRFGDNLKNLKNVPFLSNITNHFNAVAKNIEGEKPVLGAPDIPLKYQLPPEKLTEFFTDPKRLVMMAGSNIPQMAALGLLSKVSKPMGLMSMGVIEGGEAAKTIYEYEKTTGKEIPDELKTIIPLTVGVINGYLENIGITAVFKKLDSPNISGRLMGAIITTLIEGGTEGLQELVSTLEEGGYNREAMIFKTVVSRVVGSVVGGLVTAGVISGPNIAFGGIDTPTIPTQQAIPLSKTIEETHAVRQAPAGKEAVRQQIAAQDVEGMIAQAEKLEEVAEQKGQPAIKHRGDISKLPPEVVGVLQRNNVSYEGGTDEYEGLSVHEFTIRQEGIAKGAGISITNKRLSPEYLQASINSKIKEFGGTVNEITPMEEQSHLIDRLHEMRASEDGAKLVRDRIMVMDKAGRTVQDRIANEMYGSEFDKLNEDQRRSVANTAFGEEYARIVHPAIEKAVATKSPMDAMTSFERSVLRWQGGVHVSSMRGQLLAREVLANIKALGVKHNRQKDILLSIEDPSIQLSESEAKARDQYIDLMKSGADWAQKLGVLDATLSNYVMHLYSDKVNALERAGALVRGRSLREKSGFSIHRTIATLKEAEDKYGLHPIYDMPTLVGAWFQSMSRASTNKKFVDSIRGMIDATGRPVVSTKYREGYINIASPDLARTTSFFKKHDIWVHPQFAAGMKAVAAPRGSNAFLFRAYTGIRGAIKRIIMYNPLIHGWNIYSDMLDEMNFDFLKTARIVVSGAKEGTIKKYGFDDRAQLQMHMAKHGVGIEAAREASGELHEGMKGNFPELISNWEKLKSHPLRSVKELNDKVLWGGIVQNAQEMMYARVYSRAIQHGFSEDGAGFMSADFVNSNLGTLTRSMFTPGQSMILNILLFARNWTISNLRLLSGSLGVRNFRAAPRFLRHTGLTKSEMKFLQVEYTKHLAKGVAGLFVLTNLITYGLTGIDWEETKKKKKVVWDKDKAHLAIQNEPEHKMDIDIGIKDKKGREIYIVPPLFRYIRDLEAWFGGFDETNKTLWNKMEPMLKLSIENAINYSVWMRRPIRHPGASGIDKAKDTGDYIARNITPYGTFAPRRGEVRTWTETLLPLLGTWLRKGVAGGTPAHWIIEYKLKKGYKLDKTDAEIDELVQVGDFSGAIQEMVENNRYSDLNAIKGRLTEYDFQLYERWNSLTKMDQQELLNSLDEKQRQQLMNALAKKR